MTEKEALFMTLFNVPWESVANMPLEKLNAITNWRVKYEEEKQKRIEEEINKQKTQVQKNNSSGAKSVYGKR